MENIKNINDIKGILYQLSGNYKKVELIPKYNNQKSFYKKAYTISIGIDSNCYNCIKLLYSYKTLVCAMIGNKNGIKYILNNDICYNYLFSNTTLKHIKEFLKQNGIKEDLTKKDIINNESKIF